MAENAMERHEFWCSCGGCEELWCMGSVVIPPSCPRCRHAMREVAFLQFAWQWNEKGRRNLVAQNVLRRNSQGATNLK